MFTELTLSFIYVALLAENAEVKNGREFAVYCDIYKLATADPNTTDLTGSETSADTKTIDDLYLVSLPDANFSQKNFSTYNEQQWKEKKAQLQAVDPTTKKPKYQRYANDALRTTLHTAIAKLKEAANSAQQRKTAAITLIKGLHEEVKKVLKTALTGDGGKEDNDDAVYGTHENHCATGGTNKQGKALASDIACLCAAATATNLCDHKGGVTTYDNGRSNNAAGAKAAFQTLKGRCGNRASDNFVSPSKIDAAVAAFAALFGTSKKTGDNPENIIGGSGADDTCDGTDTNKACVNYNGVIGNKDVTTIPWVKQLLKAKELLLEAEKQRLQIDTNNALIHSLTTQSWAIYATLGIQKDRQTEASQSAQAKESIPPACSERKRPTCTDPCEWKEKDEKGECKPKAGTKNPVEGTGESQKEGAAATGCAKDGTDKTACKKDKTGDKQNCAFRKGKDNEDDKDTEKFRNSSILVNKKLALIVSVFISLVF